jgi:phage/plasmid primase-like uncharacterized protein
LSGGKKKFRLWKSNRPDYNGAAVCTCGKWHNGLDLIMDVNGCTFREALEDINRYLGDPCGALDNKSNKNRHEVEARKEKRLKEAEKLHNERESKLAKQDKFFVDLLKKTWSQTLPISHSDAKPLWLYLKNRGINPQILHKIKDLRFHPELEHYMGGQLLGKYPAMVCLYRDSTSRPISIHRTFLTPDGFKADLPHGEKPKRMMPAPSYVKFNGGAIRLMNYKRVLSVTEGLETAYSVIDATGLSTWATFCDSMLADFAIPDDVEFLIIWADKDISLAGEKAAKTLKQKAWDKGVPCQIMIPGLAIPKNQKSIDWNDVLELSGRLAFPRPKIRDNYKTA